jgi:hypothetical protein
MTQSSEVSQAYIIMLAELLEEEITEVGYQDIFDATIVLSHQFLSRMFIPAIMEFVRVL